MVNITVIVGSTGGRGVGVEFFYSFEKNEPSKCSPPKNLPQPPKDPLSYLLYFLSSQTYCHLNIIYSDYKLLLIKLLSIQFYNLAFERMITQYYLWFWLGTTSSNDMTQETDIITWSKLRLFCRRSKKTQKSKSCNFFLKKWSILLALAFYRLDLT